MSDQTWPPSSGRSEEGLDLRSQSAEDISRMRLRRRRNPLLVNNYDLFTRNEKETKKQTKVDVGLIDLVLFFACAVGVSVGWTGILSALSFFSKLYGKSSFLYFNVAVYLPSLPVAIIQTKYDGQCDFKFGSTTAMCFRGIISIIGMTICVGALPYYAKNADHLAICVGLTGIIGLCSAIVYGSFYQIASLINSNGWLQAAFAMGYQGSGILVLIVALAVDFVAADARRERSLPTETVPGHAPHTIMRASPRRYQ